VASAERWDLDYLEQNLGNGDFSVFLSRNHKFKYFDDKKISPSDSRLDFTPPTRRVDMKLPDFIRKLRQWRRGEERQVICSTFILQYCPQCLPCGNTCGNLL
jgi:hypoxia-inducible factor 1-alpha inhibitor (HIF hydroxylase)